MNPDDYDREYHLTYRDLRKPSAPYRHKAPPHTPADPDWSAAMAERFPR